MDSNYLLQRGIYYGFIAFIGFGFGSFFKYLPGCLKYFFVLFIVFPLAESIVQSRAYSIELGCILGGVVFAYWYELDFGFTRIRRRIYSFFYSINDKIGGFSEHRERVKIKKQREKEEYFSKRKFGGSDNYKQKEDLEKENEEIRGRKDQLNRDREKFEQEKKGFDKSKNNNPYEVLGVDNDITCEELHKMYKIKANAVHPDKVSHLSEKLKNIANEQFKLLNWAYNEIKKQKGCK